MTSPKSAGGLVVWMVLAGADGHSCDPAPPTDVFATERAAMLFGYRWLRSAWPLAGRIYYDKRPSFEQYCRDEHSEGRMVVIYDQRVSTVVPSVAELRRNYEDAVVVRDDESPEQLLIDDRIWGPPGSTYRELDMREHEAIPAWKDPSGFCSHGQPVAGPECPCSYCLIRYKRQP